MLLKEEGNKIKLLKEIDFNLEKEMQCFFENNITEILDLRFLATEFVVSSFRIDTLAFDEEQKSFKIIEYKNVKNNSLVDQGYTYLKLLLERKADFVLKYNEVTNSNLRINDIDWSQSRIIFVSPIFTAYQLNATDFKNIPVDLIKVTRYEEKIYEINVIQKTSNVKVEELNVVNYENKKVDKEIKVYTEDDHLNTRSNNVKELYYYLKEKILESDNIDLEVKKYYIAFKGRTNIVDIEFTNHFVRVDINMKKGTLKDPLNKTFDQSAVGHWGNGDYRIDIKTKEEADYFLILFNQSLTVNKK